MAVIEPEQEQIEELKTTRFRLKVRGTKPLMVHNIRLANPLDPWTKALKDLVGDRKRRNTDEGRLLILRTEARGAIYETEDGLVGMPMDNIYATLQEAAKAFKRGADIERALLYEPIAVPLIIDGKTWKVDDYLSGPDVASHIDYRPVGVNRAKTMRARPIFQNWAFNCEFSLIDKVVDLRDLAPILERAGQFVGLCERRPRYGTFKGEVEEIV